MRVQVSVDAHAPHRFSLGQGELALEALEPESRDYDWKDQRITASLHSPGVAARERFLLISEADAWPDASTFLRSPDGRREARCGTRTPHDLTADRTLEVRRVGDADSTSGFTFPRSLGSLIWAGSAHVLLEGETLLDLDTGTLVDVAFDGELCAVSGDATLAFLKRGSVLGVATLAW